MGNVTNTHPAYADMREQWLDAFVAFQGERAIKAEGPKYLPYTANHLLDGAPNANTTGMSDYNAYRMRAVYPGYYARAVLKSVAAMHSKPPPAIELPPGLDILETNANALGETLQAVLRRVNSAQLSPGRIGVLGDLRYGSQNLRQRAGNASNARGATLPKLSLYSALSCRNWDDTSPTDDASSKTFVVLDESGYEVVDYAWDFVARYRVLAMCSLDGGRLVPDPAGKIYATAEIIGNQDIAGAEFIAPNVNGETLSKIPFEFINSENVGSAPCEPPLRALSDACATIYRADADHRHTLHMQGQATLVTIGESDPEIDEHGNEKSTRVGAGAKIRIPLGGGDAKYISVPAAGLSEQREAKAEDHSMAKDLAGELVDRASADPSGESLRRRKAESTVGLFDVANVGADGLARVMKTMAPWFNANPDDIVLAPNLDFTDDELNPENMDSMARAKMNGFPISYESMHTWAAKRGATQLSYEEEQIAIAAERPEM